MIRDVLLKFNIDHAAFVPASLCRAANRRLFAAVPEKANVVFMLFPYYAGEAGKKLSAYGAVYDYHGFAREVFSSLESYLNEKYPESFNKGYADHSPYLECEGAALAGLGVIGKNSLLITEKYSSYVFIGELITTLTSDELLFEGIPEGTGEISYCEGCNACVKACPAGCAGGDSREGCISSVTQKKGELTKEETALIKKGGSIWGCDACQAACPHTKRALKKGTIYTNIPYFADSYLGEDPVEKIEKMDDETFSRYPFAWRKRPTIERNIRLLKEKHDD